LLVEQLSGVGLVFVGPELSSSLVEAVEVG